MQSLCQLHESIKLILSAGYSFRSDSYKSDAAEKSFCSSASFAECNSFLCDSIKAIRQAIYHIIGEIAARGSHRIHRSPQKRGNTEMLLAIATQFWFLADSTNSAHGFSHRQQRLAKKLRH